MPDEEVRRVLSLSSLSLPTLPKVSIKILGGMGGREEDGTT